MYTQRYDLSTGKFNGVLRTADGANIPYAAANSDWQKFLEWNSAQPTPLSLDDIAPAIRKRVRDATDIVVQLRALTTGQKNAIWTDITTGTPPKILALSGTSKPIIQFLKARVQSGVLTAPEVTEHKLYAVALFCLDNPTYLVNPTFDPTINIEGDEVDS